jgi:hypothetical protein
MERAADWSQPRKWLYISWALMGVKVAITVFWTMQRHHVAPHLSHAVQETLFWITKITPPLFVTTLILWAREIQSRTLTIVFSIFLIVVIPFDIVIVYAMFHGWRGWQF